jgi:hypothetical protein
MSREVTCPHVTPSIYDPNHSPGVSAGSCSGCMENPCSSGCWFLLSVSGCKQGVDCRHCHRESCCSIADMHRRELRREHSRLRPSKKKRDRITKLRVQEATWPHEQIQLMPSERWEMSHNNTSSISTSTSEPLTPPAGESLHPNMSLEDLQHLLDMIKGSIL